MPVSQMTITEELSRLRSESSALRKQNARLRNSNALLRQRATALAAENKQQKQRIRELEEQVQSIQVQLESLQEALFGRRKRKAKESINQEKQKRKQSSRTAASYQRKQPDASEITHIQEYHQVSCPDCSHPLTHLEEVVRYEEDLPDLEILPKVLKQVTKKIIQRGYCRRCKRVHSSHPIKSPTTTLGENVQKYIAYLIVIMRLSYEQVRNFLNDTATITISDGEITRILTRQSELLQEEEDRLLRAIRDAPSGHMDETTWKVQKEEQGKYCWIYRSAMSEDTIFLMGRSRGKKNAAELRGAYSDQVGITDDYGAYKNLFSKHQLCMAHPARKLRELAQSQALPSNKRKLCSEAYNQFSTIYHELRAILSSPFNKKVWASKREEYLHRFKELASPNGADPKSLQKIKASLYENAENYLTCLDQPGIPCDNNKAERGIRHIVIKRRISYGSKSQRGAEVFGILASTMLSLWWRKPQNFFAEYNAMIS